MYSSNPKVITFNHYHVYISYVAPETRKAQHILLDYEVTATQGYATLYSLTAIG